MLSVNISVNILHQLLTQYINKLTIQIFFFLVYIIIVFIKISVLYFFFSILIYITNYLIHLQWEVGN